MTQLLIQLSSGTMVDQVAPPSLVSSKRTDHLSLTTMAAFMKTHIHGTKTQVSFISSSQLVLDTPLLTLPQTSQPTICAHLKMESLPCSHGTPSSQSTCQMSCLFQEKVMEESTFHISHGKSINIMFKLTSPTPPASTSKDSWLVTEPLTGTSMYLHPSQRPYINSTWSQDT